MKFILIILFLFISCGKPSKPENTHHIEYDQYIRPNFVRNPCPPIHGQKFSSNLKELLKCSDLDSVTIIYLSDAFYESSIDMKIEFKNDKTTIYYRINKKVDKTNYVSIERSQNWMEYRGTANKMVSKIISGINKFKPVTVDFVTLDGYMLDIDCMNFKDSIYSYIDISNSNEKVPAAFSLYNSIILLYHEIAKTDSILNVKLNKFPKPIY